MDSGAELIMGADHLPNLTKSGPVPQGCPACGFPSSVRPSQSLSRLSSAPKGDRGVASLQSAAGSNRRCLYPPRDAHDVAALTVLIDAIVALLGGVWVDRVVVVTVLGGSSRLRRGRTRRRGPRRHRSSCRSSPWRPGGQQGSGALRTWRCPSAHSPDDSGRHHRPSPGSHSLH